MNFIEQMIQEGSKQDPLQLLLEGVHNWKSVFPSRRTEPTWKDWASLIKDHIEVQRVSLKRFEEFIKDTPLYIEDNYLRYKEIITETLEESEEESLEESLEEKIEQVTQDEEDTPTSIVEGPIGPKMLPCGHNGWYTQEEDEWARSEGHCCAGGKHKNMIFWNVRGLLYPIPEKLRKENVTFNPEGCGYCTHPETGLYIGGIQNNCVYNKDNVRCKYHRQ